MKSTREELGRSIKKSLSLLKTLRDEIRVDVHLAGMGAKDAWKRLEAKLEDAERSARDATEASGKKLEELVEAARRFRKDLGAKRPQERRA